MLILPCNRSIQVIDNRRRNAKLCHRKNVDDVGNNTIHANQFCAHIQIHRSLTEKPQNQECKLRNHAEKAVSK